MPSYINLYMVTSGQNCYFYEKLAKNLQAMVFVMNTYEPCISKIWQTGVNSHGLAHGKYETFTCGQERGNKSDKRGGRSIRRDKGNTGKETQLSSYVLRLYHIREIQSKYVK